MTKLKQSDYNQIYMLLKSRIQCLEISTALLLRCSRLQHSVCHFFPTFRKKKKHQFRIRIFKTVHGIIHREISAATFFETSRSNYPTTQCIKPEDILPQQENRFVSDKTFQLLVISILVMRQAPRMTPPYLPLQFLYLSSFFTQATRSMVLIIFALLTFNWTIW